MTAPVDGSGSMPAWMTLVANFILNLDAVDKWIYVIVREACTKGHNGSAI
jgi:hypothetical protein